MAIALGEVLTAIQAEDFSSVLSSMAALEWNSERWQVEAMTEVSAETLLLYTESDNGWLQFFFLQNRVEGGLYYLTGVVASGDRPGASGHCGGGQPAC